MVGACRTPSSAGSGTNSVEPTPAPPATTDAPSGPRELTSPSTRYGHPKFPADVAAWGRLPDSGHLAAAYADGMVRVWDPNSGTSTPALAVHPAARIQHLCVSAGGIITAADDGRIRRTSFDGLGTNAELEGPWCGADAKPGCGIRSLECMPTSDMLALHTHDERLILIESIDQPDRRRVVESLIDAVLAPDGSTLALVVNTDDSFAFSLLREPLGARSEPRPLPCAFQDAYWPRMQFSPQSDRLALSMGESSLPSQLCLWSLGSKAPTVRSLTIDEGDRSGAADGEPYGTVQARNVRFGPSNTVLADLTVGWSGEGFEPEYRETVTWNARSTKVLSRRPPPKTRPHAPVERKGPVLVVRSPGAAPKSLPPWTEDDERLTAPITAFDVPAAGTQVHLMRHPTSVMSHVTETGALTKTHQVSWPEVGELYSMAASDDGTRALLGYANTFPEENWECDKPHDGGPGGLLRIELDTGTRTELVRDKDRIFAPLAFLPGGHTALVCHEDYGKADHLFECGAAYGPGPEGTLVRMDLDAGTTESLPFSFTVCPTRAALSLSGERVAVLRQPADQEVSEWGEAAYDEDPYFDVEVVSWSSGASVFRTTRSRPVLSYALSDDGDHLAISMPREVELFDVDGGKVVRRFELDPSTSPSSLAVSPNGDLLVVGFEDGSIRYWENNREGLTDAPRVHTARILELRFDAAGTLYSASLDHSAFRWPR